MLAFESPFGIHVVLSIETAFDRVGPGWVFHGLRTLETVIGNFPLSLQRVPQIDHSLGELVFHGLHLVGLGPDGWMIVTQTFGFVVGHLLLRFQIFWVELAEGVVRDLESRRVNPQLIAAKLEQALDLALQLEFFQFDGSLKRALDFINRLWVVGVLPLVNDAPGFHDVRQHLPAILHNGRLRCDRFFQFGGSSVGRADVIPGREDHGGVVHGVAEIC